MWRDIFGIKDSGSQLLALEMTSHHNGHCDIITFRDGGKPFQDVFYCKKRVLFLDKSQKRLKI